MRAIEREQENGFRGDQRDPERYALPLQDRCRRAGGFRRTSARGNVQAPESEPKCRERHGEKNRVERFERAQAGCPGATQAERNQHERSDTAGRCADGRTYASEDGRLGRARGVGIIYCDSFHTADDTVRT